MEETRLDGIAVLGMAGRFPGAPDLERFWANLRDGVESVLHYDDDELEAAGVPAEVRRDPRYVPAGAPLDGVDLFDAPFFRFNPREAALMDPQHRIFLECCWEALEDAGYDPRGVDGAVGVYAGSYASNYLLFNLASHPELMRSVGFLAARILNDKDFLATRASYLLDLKGPAMGVQTACSTSLVALHQACRSLFTFECDVALAGGVGLTSLERSGYLFQEGGIFSPDGHCRPFAADAQGTVPGNGAGVVVLKRLEDAVADGDRVRAVIRGTAVNNDGALKVGFTAPSVDAQAEVIAAALEFAEVPPETVGYVEAHGTGTSLGDRIEIAALRRAFGAGGGDRPPMVLGSVKSNIGHLDAAAGIAGVIKTVLAMENRELPPSLHCADPNPDVATGDPPFRVVCEREPWESPAAPRRAGVSSFGVGGTNAHVVLEEAPRPSASGAARESHLLVVSGFTAAAANATAGRLADHLEEAPPASPEELADVAHTLARGRHPFPHRRAVVAGDAATAARRLRGGAEEDFRLHGSATEAPPPVAFLFPGQGAQHPGMGQRLAEALPEFRRFRDEALDALAPHLEEDLPALLAASRDDADAAARLRRTELAQPALFAIEHALGRLWLSWGIEPAVMLGHSVGEYAAACLAGVFSLPDGAALVAARGRLMAEMPPGAMLSVSLPEETLSRLAEGDVALAAVNAPGLGVLSGPEERIAELEARLRGERVECRRLYTSHAFHSAMMEPAAEAFAAEVSRRVLRPPRLPLLSSATGRALRGGEAMDPGYWSSQILRSVRFAAAATVLLELPGVALLEVGPGRSLAGLVGRGGDGADGASPPVTATSLPHPRRPEDELEHLLANLGRLWAAGAEVDWASYFGDPPRRRVALPTYPFERRRYWVEAATASREGGAASGGEDPEAVLEVPGPEAGHGAGGEVAEEPLEGRAADVAAVWRALLGVARIGPADDFFALGGHSLLATQAASRLRDSLGVPLTLDDLFAHPTPASLGRFLDGLTAGEAGEDDVPPLVPRPGEGPAPLSFAQRRLWFLDRLNPGDPSYNLGGAVRIGGELDAARLAAALASVASRHDALRTRFPEAAGGEGEQRVGDRLPRLPRVDLSALPGPRREEVAESVAAARISTSFDLAAAPPVGFGLLRLSPRSHLLVFVLHHMVSDAWSHGLMLRELAEIYRALGVGEVPDTPELPVQYADFSVWQRRWLEAGEMERQLAYWRQRLAGAPAVLDLPTDRPRPPVWDGRGATLEVDLPATATAAVEAMAAAAGATPFMVLLTLFRALLGRYSGQRDVVVGTVVANRTRAEVEPLIGFFANTLALRGDLAADADHRVPGAGELVARTRAETLAAYEHQDLPFERLVEELKVPRSLSHGPVFQVLLTLQNLPRRSLAAGDLTFQPLFLDPGTARFDLSLDLAPEGERLVGALGYATALFDRATVERQWGHFQELVVAAAANPDRRFDDLSLLRPAERRQLVEGWNDTAAPNSGGSVHGAILESARRQPADRPAVVGGDGTLTYGDLAARVAALAARLAASGVGRGDRVGLLLERDGEVVVALLAVLAAGAAYVPLDPAFPQERLELMVEDSGLGVLVVRGGGGWRPTGVELIDLDASGEAVGAPPPPELDASDLAYVIYTSGSTGRPKGVQVSHGAFANFLRSMARTPGMAAGETLLSVTTLSFDIAGLELLMPLLVGGTVVVAARDVAADGRRLARALAEHGADLMQATPATWRMLIDTGWAPPPGLRVLCGGEAMPPALAGALAAGEAEVWNLYGPTETSVWSSLRRITGAGSAASIGRPIANTALHVVDRRLHPLPVGVPGEVLIGGAGLARGYLGRPGQTAERFVPDPLAAEAGARLYRTGDLARRRGDGELEFLGRLDHQVKVRGFRIELGEVEAVLSALAGVGACVVVARGETAEKRLVAYLEADGDGGGVPRPETLRAALARSLPSYMVPSVFMVLDSLPLTPNGKVDRGALPEPGGESVPAQLTPPRGATEELVAAAWRSVLEIDEIGIESDFFDLGGHSLLANRVVARLREATGVEVPLRVFFEAPTVAAMAAAVERLRGAPARPPLEATGDAGPAPLSFAQERLWFLHRLDPASTAYSLPLALHLEGELAPGRLAAAVGALVRRHAVLRTVFDDGGEGPVQRVKPPAPVPLRRIDLTGLPAERRRGAARAAAEAELARPFDLRGGPVIRAVLLRREGDAHDLLLNMHHAVSDEWSLEVLTGELAAFYDGAAPPAPLTVQYTDYARWQRGWLRGEALDRLLAYWRRQLADLPPLLDLPTDRPRRAVREERGGRLRIPLSEELATAFRASSRRSGTTLFMVLLASFQVLLARVTGQRDFAVGTPVAGRSQVELEGLVGFLVNTLVLRADLSGSPGFDSVLERVRETSLQAHDHGEMPFEKLVQELDPERSLSNTPLFQVVFVLQRALRQRVLRDGLRAEPWELEAGAKFDLALNVLDDGEHLRADLLYAADLFDAATSDRLGRAWLTLCGHLVEAPGRPVGEAPLLTAEERREILAVGARRRTEAAAAERLDQRFARWVESAPGAVALRDGDDAWTYGRLAAAAGVLAGELRRRGVGPGTRVALCLERGVQAVVAILAVLRAGGAYVPLDPVHPGERLRFILDDSQAALLVTQGASAENLPGEQPPRVRLEDVLEDWPDAGAGASAFGAAAPFSSPDDPAYVIYTSGSTGRPKGVVISHRQVDRLLGEGAELFAYGPRDVWSFFHSYAFDFSVWEIWGALAHGGRLVVVPRMVSVSPRETWRLLADEGVTVLNQTPSAFRGLVRAALGAEEGERAEPGTGDLRLVIFGGEALDLASLGPWFSAFGDDSPRLVNMYGITETTVHVTYRPITAADLDRPRRGSVIGAPLADLDLHLLDGRLRPVPRGVAGEIFVGGAGLTAGYLGRPSLTALRFVPHPASGEPGDRLYRSGDLARRAGDGEVEYLGRIDHQVQLRGYRIELGEIEAALEAVPQVAESVVLVRPGPGGEEALVAWVVPSPGAAEINLCREEELRRELLRRLPEYMVPSAFVAVEALPLTANGKLDRDALPEPRWEIAGAPPARPPRGPVEELLTAILADFLGRETVTIDDDFFALGGHSLLAVGLVARVREALGIDLPVRAVFEHPRVEDLARELEGRLRSGAGRSLPPLRRQRPLPHPTPLTPAQEQLWFLHRMEPDSPALNMPLPLALRGDLSVPLLKAAVGTLVRRHESLRTYFPEDDGRPRQEVAPPPASRLPLIDLAGLPDEARRRQRRALAGREAARPFDLTAAPPLRHHLLRLSEDEHVGLFTLHHVLADDWSLGILVRELAAIYDAYEAGRPNPLPELQVQVPDFAVWQRQVLDGPVLEERLEYWRRQLAGMPEELELPRDDVAATEAGAGRLAFTLPEELTRRVGELARSTRVSRFVVLWATLALVFEQESGQRDVVIGSDVAGRDRIATESLIGFFINVLVLRCDLTGDPSFVELLERVRKVVLEAFSHGDLPFDRLVQDLRPRRSADRTPLVQAMLSYHDAPRDEMRMGSLEVEPLAPLEVPVRRDLTLFFREVDGVLLGAWVYDLTRFRESTVERLSRRYRSILEAAVEAPERTLEELRRLVRKSVAGDGRQRKRSRLEKLL